MSSSSLFISELFISDIDSDKILIRYMHETGRVLKGKTFDKYRGDLNECLRVFKASKYDSINIAFLAFYREYLRKKYYDSPKMVRAKWRVILNLYEHLRDTSQMNISFGLRMYESHHCLYNFS